MEELTIFNYFLKVNGGETEMYDNYHDLQDRVDCLESNHKRYHAWITFTNGDTEEINF